MPALAVLPAEIIRLILVFYFRKERAPLRLRGQILALGPYVSIELRIAASLFQPSLADVLSNSRHNVLNFVYCSHPMAMPIRKRPEWEHYVEKASLQEIAATFRPVVIRTGLVKVTLYSPQAMILFECERYKEVLHLLHRQNAVLVSANRAPTDLARRGFTTCALGLIPGASGFGLPWRPKLCGCSTRRRDCRGCSLRYMFNTVSQQLVLFDVNR